MLTFNKVCFGIFLLIPFFGFAQIDSFETRNVLLKEIIIQNDRNLNNTLEKKQPADLQTSTDRILEGINGISMIKRGNYALEPAIRGLNAGQISITIDGMAIFGACTDRMDPVSSYIEPNNLKSLTVSYGANDVSYGSSIGGGLNFKIKDPKLDAEKKWSGMAGAGYESNGNHIQTLAAVNYSSKNFGLNLNGLFRNSDNYTAAKGQEVQFSQFTKWNGGLAARYRIREHHYVQLNYIQDEGYDIGYPALTMDVAFARAHIGSLTYTHHRNSGLLKHLETKLYYNFIDHAMDDTKRPADQVPMHMDMPGTSRTMGFNIDAKWIKNAHEISTRVNAYQNRLHAEMTMYPEIGADMYMLTIPDAQRNVLGLDISDKITVKPGLSFLMGARMDVSGSSIYTSEGEKILSGMVSGSLSRLAVLYNVFFNPVYRVHPDVTLYANVARGMRQATLQERYGFYLFDRLDGYDYIGNPDLKNETSWNTSLGAIYQKGIWKLELQGFSYFMKNYIAGLHKEGYIEMTIGANGVKQYGNLNAATLSGMEFTGQVKIKPYLTFLSDNSFSYGVDRQGSALPMIPPFKSENQLNFESSEISFGIAGTLSAAQNHVSTEKYGETKTPGFALLHLKAAKNFKLKNSTLSLNVRVDNLLDTYYMEHLDIMKIPRMGRNLIAHATWYF